MKTLRIMAVGFLLAVAWTIGQWITNIALNYWIEKLKPLSAVKQIYL